MGICVSIAACTTRSGSAASPSAKAPQTAFADDTEELPRYHSKRLALWVPLPLGAEWRIDDHSRPQLIATHSPSRSRLMIAVFYAETLVGRSQCETLAETAGLVPSSPLQTIEDAALVSQQVFDTRVRVAIVPPDHRDAPLVGHVLAFGGYLRKCYVFDFSTEAPVSDEPALSARLAFARTRILAGLRIESLDAPGTLRAYVPAER